MIPKPFDQIDESALAALVADEVAERRDLEFKLELPDRSEKARREFLADVTSLANAHGGDLVFGIRDEDGFAKELVGIVVESEDGETLRLEQLLQSCVSPRLNGVKLKWLPIANGRRVLVMRIAASLAAPHRVTFQGSNGFYTRNSRGKYEMDVHELRQAFAGSEALPEKFRQLHAKAMEFSIGIDMPVSIRPAPTAVLSVIPLSFFRESVSLDIDEDNAVYPVKPSSIDWLPTIEGFLIHSGLITDTQCVRTMALTHRSGRVDVAWAMSSQDEPATIPAVRFESGVLESATKAQAKLRALGIEGPWVVLVSVTRMLGWELDIHSWEGTRKTWRNAAQLGQIIVEDITEESLLPIFKAFWFMFGQARREGLKVNR